MIVLMLVQDLFHCIHRTFTKLKQYTARLAFNSVSHAVHAVAALPESTDTAPAPMLVPYLYKCMVQQLTHFGLRHCCQPSGLAFNIASLAKAVV